MRREHAPITLQRMLELRQFPGFGDTDLTELATIAENVAERTFAPGATIVEAGARFPAIYLVGSGALGSTTRRWGPRRLVGALEVIANRPSADAVLASKETRVLELATSDFGELLEDNYSVLSTARRLIARRLLAFEAAHPTARAPRSPSGPLGMVDRLVLLRSQLPFASASLQALSTLAQATDEVQYAAGTRIARAGEEARGWVMLLDGRVRLRGSDQLAPPALGCLETLAEVPHAFDADAITHVRALFVPSAALFDVMEDHTDFALALVARLAGELLDLHPQVN